MLYNWNYQKYLYIRGVEEQVIENGKNLIHLNYDLV